MKVLVTGNLIVKNFKCLDFTNGAEVTWGVGNMRGDFDMIIEGDVKVESLSVFNGNLYVGGEFKLAEE